MAEEKKYRRPVYDEITKVNVNKPEAALLLKWSLEASAAEMRPVSTREIIKRLVNRWSSENAGEHPTEINGVSK